MHPIQFKEANETLAQHQLEYNPLPCFRVPGSPEQERIVCFQMTPEELVQLGNNGGVVALLDIWQPHAAYVGPSR